MPSWVEARAKRIMKSTEDKYGPEKGKQIAFALATQQSHASGKSPKKWHGKPFGTPEGRREAKEKYDLPKAEYQKTAEEPVEHTAMAGARQTKIGNLDQWNRETIEGRSLSHGTGEQPSPRPTRAQPIPVGMPGGGEAYFSPRQVGWLMSQGAFSGGGEPEKAKPSVWPRVGRAVLGGALGGIGAEVLARGVDIPPERRNLFRAGGIGLGLLASQLGEEKRAALVEGYLNRTLKHVHFLTKEAREELAKEASLGRLLAAARGVARSGGQVAKSLLPKAAPQVQQSARVLGHVPISRGPSGAIILPNAPTPPLVPSPGTLQRARASGVPADDIWELLGKYKVRPLVPPAGYRGYDPTALARSLGRPPVYGSTALRPAVSLPTGELVPPWG